MTAARGADRRERNRKILENIGKQIRSILSPYYLMRPNGLTAKPGDFFRTNRRHPARVPRPSSARAGWNSNSVRAEPLRTRYCHGADHVRAARRVMFVISGGQSNRN